MTNMTTFDAYLKSQWNEYEFRIAAYPQYAYKMIVPRITIDDGIDWKPVPLTGEEYKIKELVAAPACCSRCKEPFPYEAHESGKCYACRS